MSDWITDFNNISIRYCDRLVQIKTDEQLIEFLNLPHKGAVKLAEHILSEYEKCMKKPLNITKHSLAVEILGHVHLDKLAGFVGSLEKDGKNPLGAKAAETMKELRKHTDVIDCGEKEIDSNRQVWDALEPFHSVIYLLCGKSA